MHAKFQADRFYGFGIVEETHAHTHAHTRTHAHCLLLVQIMALFLYIAHSCCGLLMVSLLFAYSCCVPLTVICSKTYIIIINDKILNVKCSIPKALI